MTGDIGNLRALKNLQHLCLTNTKVTGDISCLNALTSLQKLYLFHMKVTGDISGLNSLTSLQELWLGDTQVTGDTASLNALASLQHPGLRRRMRSLWNCSRPSSAWTPLHRSSSRLQSPRSPNSRGLPSLLTSGTTPSSFQSPRSRRTE